MTKFKTYKLINFAKKLHFLDYLIILAIILFSILLFKFFNPEKKWVTISVFAESVPIFQASTFHVGDFEKDPLGNKIAIINGYNIFNRSLEPPISAVRDITEKKIFLEVKVLVDINPRNGEPQYKNKVIKVGSPIDFSFNTGFLKGRIMQMEGVQQDIKQETHIITVKIKNHWQWYADSLQIGEGEVIQNNEKLIEIISKEVTPAETTTTNSNGQNILTTDPTKVDITLKLKAKLLRIKNDFVIREGTQIAIGGHLSFNAGKSIIANATIINIE